MKRRSGFVSNSSSSSFVIACKDGSLTKQKLMGSFKTPKESFMYNIASDIADFLISEVKPKNWKTPAELAEDLEYIEDLPEIPEDFKVQLIFPCNDGEAVERMICEMDLIYKDSDLVLCNNSH